VNSQSLDLVIGVDVGTGSARAGVFDLKGNMLATASQPIKMWKDQGERFEQSSVDIWNAVCQSVRKSVQLAKVEPSRIVGVGFDATCSLVLIGENGEGVPAGNSRQPERNVIVWMDQRAKNEAKSINALQHDVLKYVGGKISPEMQIPKLLWLYNNLREQFDTVEHFFDLSDFLTWRATNDDTRSSCTLTCKWTYLGHEGRFDGSFFQQIGLGVLEDESFRRIGSRVEVPGTRLANGLSTVAASELGLLQGTSVAAGLIDAHAGGVGSLESYSAQLAYIFGTSACLMATTKDAVFVPGVWGPYYGAMLPNVWLLEGGQSAAGAAIEHLIKMHPAYAAACDFAKSTGKTVVDWIESQIAVREVSSYGLTLDVVDLHVVPDFLGNRSPNANPNASAVISGLRLQDNLESLQHLYVAAILGVAYGARQTIEALQNQGVDVQSLVVSGGASKSALVRQLLADATGLTVKRPQCDEPVLLGAAILASVSSGKFATMTDAMSAMNKSGPINTPTVRDQINPHSHKYGAFRVLQDADRRIGTFENYKLSWAQKVDAFQNR
jgi:D-ribulokinase